MKKLKKISISELIKGYIFNSNAIQDKENNTYSASVIDEKMEELKNENLKQRVSNLETNFNSMVGTNNTAGYATVKDYNTVITPGMYFLGGSVNDIANGPGGMGWGVLKVERYGNIANGYLVQTLITNIGIAYRMSSNTNGIGSKWRIISSSERS